MPKDKNLKLVSADEVNFDKECIPVKNQELVSVIIPCYNSAQTINKTIDSVIRQNYSNIEVIIVNDGSTDDSVEQLKKYGDKITVITQKNSGQASARNRGANYSKGKFLAFLDADDLWDKSKISEQVKLLQFFPSALVSYCDHRTIDENDDLIGDSGALNHLRPSGIILPALLYGSCIITPGVTLIRKKAWKLVGGFNEYSEFISGSEDYDFWLRLSLNGAFIYSPQTLVSYRRHKRQLTQQEDCELGRSNAHLFSLNLIENEINERKDKKLLAFYKNCKFDLLIDASWAARQSNAKKQAITYGWQSCLMRAYSLSAWKALIKSIFNLFNGH